LKPAEIAAIDQRGHVQRICVVALGHGHVARPPSIFSCSVKSGCAGVQRYDASRAKTSVLTAMCIFGPYVRITIRRATRRPGARA
jgi:hypothetical protein